MSRLRLLLIEDSQEDADLILRELARGGYEPDCHRVETNAAIATALENLLCLQKSHASSRPEIAVADGIDAKRARERALAESAACPFSDPSARRKKLASFGDFAQPGQAWPRSVALRVRLRRETFQVSDFLTLYSAANAGDACRN